MYKATSHSKHYLRRVGSHSTKGYRNGRVDTLPPEARPHEEVYQSVFQQYLIALGNHRDIRARLDRAEERIIRSSHPAAELLAERDRLLEQMQAIKTGMGQLKGLMKSANDSVLGAVLLRVMQSLLPTPLVVSVLDETRRVIGRPINERRAFNQAEKIEMLSHMREGGGEDG